MNPPSSADNVTSVSWRLTSIIAQSQSIIDKIHQDATARKDSLLEIWLILRTLLECQTGLDQSYTFLLANDGIRLDPATVDNTFSDIEYMLQRIQRYVEAYFEWFQETRSRPSNASTGATHRFPDILGLKRCVEAYEQQCSVWTDTVRFAAMGISNRTTQQSLPARPAVTSAAPRQRLSSLYEPPRGLPSAQSPSTAHSGSNTAEAARRPLHELRTSTLYGTPLGSSTTAAVQGPSQVYSAPAASALNIVSQRHWSSACRTHPSTGNPPPPAAARVQVDEPYPTQSHASHASARPPPARFASGLIPVEHEGGPETGLGPDSYPDRNSQDDSQRRQSYSDHLPILADSNATASDHSWPSHFLAPGQIASCMVMTSDEPLTPVSTNVLVWLERALENSIRNNNVDPRYHLIFCPSGPATPSSDLTVPFSNAAFEKLIKLLSIPHIFSEVLSEPISRIVRWSKGSAALTEGIMLRAPVSIAQASENWAIHLAWNKDQKNLFGFVVGYRQEDLDWLNKSRHKLASFSNGLHILLLLLEAIIARDATDLRAHGQKLFEIEMDTRFFKWSDSGDTMVDNAPDIGLDRLVKTLNAVVSQLGFHELRACGLKTLISRLRDSAKGAEDEFDGRLHDVDTLLQTVKYQQVLAGSQAQVIYSMLSQRDNRINLAISRDNVMLTKTSLEMARMAKADSSAMKTLAILSTLFLPGTFFSALFSMSMFDWRAQPQQSVIGPYFWVYWAFTLPVTFVLFIYFYMFVLVDISQNAAASAGPPDYSPLDQWPEETMFQKLRRRLTRSATDAAMDDIDGKRSNTWSGRLRPNDVLRRARGQSEDKRTQEASGEKAAGHRTVAL